MTTAGVVDDMSWRTIGIEPPGTHGWPEWHPNAGLRWQGHRRVAAAPAWLAAAVLDPDPAGPVANCETAFTVHDV